jgi:hypothetical protein
VVIEPRVREFAWDDFAKTPELVAAGEEAAMAAMPRVRTALEAAMKRAGFAEEPRLVATGALSGRRNP